MSEMNEQIIERIKERMDKGRKQYGHGLLEKSGYDWVQGSARRGARLIDLCSSQTH